MFLLFHTGKWVFFRKNFYRYNHPPGRYYPQDKHGGDIINPPDEPVGLQIKDESAFVKRTNPPNKSAGFRIESGGQSAFGG
jgi:hypothetical protein